MFNQLMLKYKYIYLLIMDDYQKNYYFYTFLLLQKIINIFLFFFLYKNIYKIYIFIYHSL